MSTSVSDIDLTQVSLNVSLAGTNSTPGIPDLEVWPPALIKSTCQLSNMEQLPNTLPSRTRGSGAWGLQAPLPSVTSVTALTASNPECSTLRWSQPVQELSHYGVF